MVSAAVAIAEVRMLARPIAEICAAAAGIQNPLSIGGARRKARLFPNSDIRRMRAQAFL
ncbi:MAG: hypothetical protein WBE48_00795 [Xanthobacteraceae bacterium]